MPTVIDKATGEIVAEFSYDSQGEQQARNMADSSPDLAISNDAMYRSTTTYDDGSSMQNPSENMGNPYDDMSNLMKKSNV